MRRFFVAAALCLTLFGSTGCFSFVDWTHNERHIQAWENKLRSFHKSLDRFFLDYDWDDPLMDTDDGYGGM